MIQKLISIQFSLVAYLLFILYLCIFHVIQVVALRIFGYEAHKKSVDALNFFLLSVVYVLFSSAKIDFKTELPTGETSDICGESSGDF